MAAPDPAKLIAPFPEFDDMQADDVPRYMATMANQAVAAASLDPPGSTFGQGAKAPGHVAAVGLVIAAGNYAWMTFEVEISTPIVDFAAELLKQLGYGDVHGWRQN